MLVYGSAIWFVLSLAILAIELFFEPNRAVDRLAILICKYSVWVSSAQSLRKQNPVNSMVAKDLKSYLVL